jgi:8-oxo-dGTP pyrophosphatase MutT (NUDIX family)
LVRVEAPELLELNGLFARYGQPKLVREFQDIRELGASGTAPAPPTKGAALVAAFDARGRVACVRKCGDPRWILPSGRVMPDEPVEEGAAREAREEAGLEVELVAMPVLLVVRYRLPDSELERWCPVFAARALRGDLSPKDHAEIEEAAWLSEAPAWWAGTWREAIMSWWGIVQKEPGRPQDGV